MGGGGAFWSEVPERGFLENLDKNLLFEECVQECACASQIVSHILRMWRLMKIAMWFSSDGSQFWAWIPHKVFCTCWQWQQSCYQDRNRRRESIVQCAAPPAISSQYRGLVLESGGQTGRLCWGVESKWDSIQSAGTEDWATEVWDPNRAPHRVPVPSSGSKQGACTGEWGPNRAPHRATTLRSRDQMRLHTGHLYWGVGSIRVSIQGSGIKQWGPRRVHKVGST